LHYLFFVLEKDIHINAINLSEKEKRFAQLDQENIQLERQLNIYNAINSTENVSPLENAVLILKDLICSVTDDDLAEEIVGIIGSIY
jgi:hypothetical protein